MCFPEINSTPEIYFNQNLVIQYFSSNRIIKVQTRLSFRALAILGILEKLGPNILVNLGCGTGVTEKLTPVEKNFTIGLDVSYFMMKIYSRRTIMTESILLDIQITFLPFRPQCIDLCISVSCIQWLKILPDSNASNVIIFEEKQFFDYRCINNLCVMQFFPISKKILKKILKIFTNIKHKIFLIIDKKNKETSKKYFIFCRNYLK
jgi:18S rRNA (guanine1575-N7)-methyltransferase